jgi:hypothetical protein
MAFTDISLPALTDAQNKTLQNRIISASLSWTMDAVSELSFSVDDPNMKMFKSNWFQVRRDMEFGGSFFEIAAVEVGPGQGQGAEVKIQARLRAIQRMKRDKEPKAIQGVTATDYAALAAQEFGLGFVGEATKTRRSVQKATGSDSDESIWSVVQRLAGEAQFSAFESDGTLYFASQEWLLGKWANIQIAYPSPASSPYQVLEIPSCRRSDDQPIDADGTMVLARSNTTLRLRPGMTMILSGMGEFDREYLLGEVTFDLEEPDPVGVSFKTPYRKQPKR